jgi:hypothetical protein
MLGLLISMDRKTSFTDSTLYIYLSNLCVAFSQAVNAILGGKPDELFSTRIERNKDHFLLGRIGSLIEVFDPGHLARYKDKDMGDRYAWKFPDEK